VTTKEKPAAERLAEEERKMDAEIERLEAEQRELASPSRALTWDEVQAGAAEDLEKRERRRAFLPRLVVAAKVKRLEIRRARLEAEAGPLRERRDEAHERLKTATAKRWEAVEEENAARYAYSNPNMRLESIERRTREIGREIRKLRGEG
jgi:chromosome segregation ATPase